uniref:Uncharacterized protein n=1 Tax=Oryza sativa subsp. japonica TaxID=39947 RepID=Q69U58_ORYSJ|nr:hypothetical protein [Oryza sativa Japonica Group]
MTIEQINITSINLSTLLRQEHQHPLLTSLVGGCPEFACKAADVAAASNNTSERVTDSMEGSSNKDMNSSKWKLNSNQAAEEEVMKSLYEIADSSAATIRQLEDKQKYKMSHLADDGLEKIHGGFDLTKDEVKSLLQSIKETAYTTD